MLNLAMRAAVLSMAFAPLAVADDHDAATGAAAFLAAADTVVAEIAAATPDVAFIDVTITSMLASAQPVISAFGVKYTQCAEQLAKVIALYPDINVWTPQEIRTKIEAGQALPPAQGCYPARDIVAHPAITRALVRPGFDPALRPRLGREMNEAIEHMAGIVADLGL